MEESDSASAARLREIAEQAVDPCVTNAAVVAAFWEDVSGGAIDPQAGYEAVRAQALEVHEGGFSAAEATLVGQAAALNVIFAEMARRGQAALNRPGIAADRYLRMAMRAQSQCRATLHELRGLADRPRRPDEAKARQVTVVRRIIVRPPPLDADGNMIRPPEEEKPDDWLARNDQRPLDEG